jgi:hypothetical protein
VRRNEGWETLYKNQAEGLNVLQSVDEAIAWVNELINKVETV